MSRRAKGIVAVAATALAAAAGLLAALPTEAARAQALPSFSSCTDFLRHTKQGALRMVGPYGLEGYGFGFGIAVEEPAAEASGDAAAPTSDFSGTNVQEAGVDEPDLAKGNGKTLFVMAQGQLQAVEIGGPVPTLLGTLAIPESWGGQLLLYGDRLLVVSSGGIALEPLAEEDAAVEIFPPSVPTTTLTEIDVSNPASMEVVKTMAIEASYVSARLVGSTVRLVTTSGPTGLPFVYPQSGEPGDIAKATKRNRAIVRNSRVANWLPSYRVTDASGRTTRKPLLTCPQVRHPEDFSGLGLLSVLTIDLSRGIEPIDTDAVQAGGEIVYASQTGLYVATQQWLAPLEDPAEAPPSITTAIHKFDISSPSSTEYRGSGEVSGYLLNQFSLSEHDGYLRVATTSEPTWWGDTNTESESAVTVFEEQAGQLVQVGQVGGLGRGERIYAVRFLGDLGYVVTFRQVDPLYVVDLSVPTAPVVRGELKIPGFSSYLHPIGESTLFGVGQDATPEGRVLGTQLSVFDVSNPDSPTRLQHLTFGQGWSSAEYDHHAFLYWAPTQTAVLPVETYTDDGAGNVTWNSVAVVLHAGPTGLAQLGTIEHGQLAFPGDTSGQTYPVPIFRAFVAGDVLYTVSDAGVKANSLATLAELAWVSFPTPTGGVGASPGGAAVETEAPPAA